MPGNRLRAAYLTHDALNAIAQVSARIDDARGGRNMGREDADFAVCCAVPLDAPGLTVVARPARRPGERLEHCDALFSRKYGQSTGVCMFDKVFVPWERVFYAGGNGTWEHSAHYVSGGLIVTLPGGDEDHNPETAARLSEVLRADPAVPYEQRIEAARFARPARAITKNRQSGKCCDSGCTTPGQPVMVDLPASLRP